MARSAGTVTRMPGDPVAPRSDGGFTVGRRGYDPQQVDAHLRRVDAEIRILVADRDAAVDQATQLGRELEEARLRADRLRTQVRTMAGRPSDVQGMSERMRTMLRLAEDEVADMLQKADTEVARRLAEAKASVDRIVSGAAQEAADIRTAAQADVERASTEAARHRAETDAACSADRDALAAERAATAEAIAIATERAERERAQAWSESEARRTTVEEDFALAMDQRRAEALAAVHAERARTAEWVRRSREETAQQARAQLSAAEETARRIIAAAQARAKELEDLRTWMAVQLQGTRAQLGEALAALAPGSAEAFESRPSAIAPPVEQHTTAADSALPAPDPAPTGPSTSEPSEPSTEPVPIVATATGTLILDAPPVDDPSTEGSELEPMDVDPGTGLADAAEQADAGENGSDHAEPDHAEPEKDEPEKDAFERNGSARSDLPSAAEGHQSDQRHPAAGATRR
jgi:DivIVA domain-containing protein